MYKRPCKRAAVSIGALLGNLEGEFVYWDFREKKKLHIWVPFLGPRRHYKLSMRAIWNFSKEQGLLS
jgi:hypothetical protein